MIGSIDDYLSQLKKALHGCDRATIQDALSDAEEHLRTALASATAHHATVSEADALSQIIDSYGMPEEVATAYREIEHRLTPALAQPSYPEEPEEVHREKDERPLLVRFFGVFADLRVWGAFLYLLFSLLTGTLYFTWAVTGISLSAGLLVLIVGLPFTGLFILSVWGIGLVEGRIVEALLGVRMPRRAQYRRGGTGLWPRFRSIILDGHTWLSLVYMILQLPLGIAYFTVLVTLIAVALFAIATPILQLGFDISVVTTEAGAYYFAGWMLPLLVVAGILLATLTMHLARYLGRMHGALAKALLVRR
ncbi:MAG: sensor domain-containing protein [Chloroflexota bacterium]|nr:sensor domain-containing protein [Chloroflexota bacterium]